MTIKQLSAAIALILTLVGATWGLIEWHDRFAPTKELKRLELQSTLNQLSYSYSQTNVQLSKAENRLHKNPQDIQAKLDKQEAQLSKQAILSQIADIKGKLRQ